MPMSMHSKIILFFLCRSVQLLSEHFDSFCTFFTRFLSTGSFFIFFAGLHDIKCTHCYTQWTYFSWKYCSRSSFICVFVFKKNCSSGDAVCAWILFTFNIANLAGHDETNDRMNDKNVHIPQYNAQRKREIRMHGKRITHTQHADNL